MCKKTPSDVSLCRGSSVICFGAKATDKKSSPHTPSQVTVLTSLWSAGTSACVSGQWTGSGNWSGLNKLHRDQFLGSGLLLNCKNEQQGKGRVKIMICIVSYSCMGKQEGFEHGPLCRRKGSCISSRKNQVVWGCSPRQDEQMGRAVQKQNNKSRGQFQQFHNSNWLLCRTPGLNEPDMNGDHTFSLPSVHWWCDEHWLHMGKAVLVVDLTRNFCKLPGLQREKQETGTKEVFVSEVLFEGRERG